MTSCSSLSAKSDKRSGLVWLRGIPRNPRGSRSSAANERRTVDCPVRTLRNGTASSCRRRALHLAVGCQARARASLRIAVDRVQTRNVSGCLEQRVPRCRESRAHARDHFRGRACRDGSHGFRRSIRGDRWQCRSSELLDSATVDRRQLSGVTSANRRRDLWPKSPRDQAYLVRRERLLDSLVGDPAEKSADVVAR